MSKLQAHSEVSTSVLTLWPSRQVRAGVSIGVWSCLLLSRRVTRMTFLAVMCIHLFQFRFAWCVTLMLCRLQVTAIETAVSETDVFAFSTCIYDIITLDQVAVDNEEFVFFEISAYDCRTGYTTTGRGSTARVPIAPSGRACILSLWMTGFERHVGVSKKLVRMACGYRWTRKLLRPMSCTGEGHVEGRHRRHHLAHHERRDVQVHVQLKSVLG